MKEIVIIKETKVPVDHRVALIPLHVGNILEMHSSALDIKIEESDLRCFSDSEYYKNGIKKVDNNVNYQNQIYVGVKEVQAKRLKEKATYFFFSHTIKGQPYNMPLLKECLHKKVKLIDYEAIRGEDGRRLIGFGDVAGVVGTYNTLKWYANYCLDEYIPGAYELSEENDLYLNAKKIKFVNEKIVVTGKGAVGKAACDFLKNIGFEQVSLERFVSEDLKGLFFCNLDYRDYYVSNKSILSKYLHCADILITGHYYEKGDPFILTKNEFEKLNRLKVVGDLSCDIDGPIACTIKSTTIQEPVFLYDRLKHEEVSVCNDHTLVVMAVDNLPCELPKIASQRFSDKFRKVIVPELLKEVSSVLNNATICDNGELTEKFSYLKKYI